MDSLSLFFYSPPLFNQFTPPYAPKAPNALMLNNSPDIEYIPWLNGST